ncbi:hypothetical protein BC831DRAFT_450010, partial [Entophlyctis helioformis]
MLRSLMTIQSNYEQLDADASTASTRLYRLAHSGAVTADTLVPIQAVLEALLRFSLLRQQMVSLISMMADFLGPDPHILWNQVQEITEKFYNKESLRPWGSLANVAIQKHVFHDAIVNAYVGRDLLAKWVGFVRHSFKTDARNRGSRPLPNLQTVLQRLYKWLSLKIGLYFYQVIHPRQMANALSNRRRVHFPDEVEPEYLLPILEYHRTLHPINTGKVRFEDGFVCHGTQDGPDRTYGIRSFPAILSYPQDPPYEHWPNIISILQSHNRFFKQRIRQRAADTRRATTSLFSMLGNVWPLGTASSSISSTASARNASLPRPSPALFGSI